MSVGQQNRWSIRRIEEFMEELVAAYRDLLSGQELSATAHLRELLPVYAAELLPDINQRIADCHALIKRGLRDEALGRANEPPNLMRVANVLDLDRFGADEVSRWKDASEIVGLVWPAPLRFDLLGDLIEAEAEVADLKPLLDTWRRLNIGRAPLPQRLAALRQISERDGSCQVWRDLLGSHEKHRFAEIKAALARLNDHLATAVDSDDEVIDGELRSLLHELRGPWTIERPPGALTRSGEDLEVRAREQRVDRMLDRLPGELESAAAALAEASLAERGPHREKVKATAEHWHKAMRERGTIASDDPRLLRARPVLDYVHRLAEAENLMLEVAHGVSDAPSRFRHRQAWARGLEQMMDRIDDAVSGLPDADIDVDRISALSDRVARIAVEMRRESRVRSLAIAATVGAVVAGSALGTWWTFEAHRHEVLVANAVDSLETTTEEVRRGDQRDVAQIGADWSERLRQDPRVSAALDRLRDEARSQEDRRTRAHDLLADVNKTIAALKHMPREDPLAPWPTAFADASRSVDQLASGGLAVGDREKSLLEGPAAALRALATGYTQAADAALVEKVKQLEMEIAATEALFPDDFARADTALTDIQKRLDALIAAASSLACPNAAAPHRTARLVSPTAASSVAPRSKVVDQLAAVRRRREVYAGLETRERNADDLLEKKDFAAYADMLREIADDLAGSPIARDYGDVARDHTSWKALAEWEALLPRLKAAPRASSDEALLLRKLLENLPDEVDQLGFVRSTKTWMDPLLARAEEFSEARLEDAEESLRTLFGGRYGTTIDAVAWEKKSPEPRPLRYFLLFDRPLPDKPRGVPHLVAWQNKGVWQKKNWLFDPATYVIDDAPQKVIASRCLDIVERMPTTKATAWAVDRFAVEILACCSEQRPPLQPGGVSIDPCLHALLLRYVVLDLCELSSFVAARLKESLKLVQAGFAPDGQPIQIKGADNFAFTIILDPAAQHSQAVALAARKACDTFLETVRREVKAAGEQLAAEQAAITHKHASLTGYTCVGRLRRSRGGRWSVSGGTPATRQNCTLYVLKKDRSPLDMAECVTCGDDGTIPAGKKVDGRAGDPVYIKVSIVEDR
jgi:hypothetical protein